MTLTDRVALAIQAAVGLIDTERTQGKLFVRMKELSSFISGHFQQSECSFWWRVPAILVLKNDYAYNFICTSFAYVSFNIKRIPRFK